MFKYLWVSFGPFLESVKIDPKIAILGVQNLISVQNLILDPSGRYGGRRWISEDTFQKRLWREIGTIVSFKAVIDVAIERLRGGISATILMSRTVLERILVDASGEFRAARHIDRLAHDTRRHEFGERDTSDKNRDREEKIPEK